MNQAETATEMALQRSLSFCKIQRSNVLLVSTHLDVEESKFNAWAVPKTPGRPRCATIPKLLPQVSACVYSTSSETQNKQQVRTWDCPNMGSFWDLPGLCYSLLDKVHHHAFPVLQVWDPCSIPVVLKWGDSTPQPQRDPEQCMETFWVAIQGREKLLLSSSGQGQGCCNTLQ